MNNVNCRRNTQRKFRSIGRNGIGGPVLCCCAEFARENFSTLESYVAILNDLQNEVF
ncbi:hypothetical protein D917_03657, partial [Trichinella nativa]